MKSSIVRYVVLFACVFAGSSFAKAADYYLEHMKANKILFLGNSITLHPPRDDGGVYWPNNWGMAASEQSKDYVHLLGGKLNSATGNTLRIDPTDRPANYGDPVVTGDANVVNIADIFERNTNYQTSLLQEQMNWKADIVVLQFGENLSVTNDQMKTNLRTLLTDLKNSGNPNIFLTSYIIGANSDVDAIKKELCAEDSSHRVFVDMSKSGITMGAYGHPNDAGMAAIANTLYSAMSNQAKVIPEPSAIAMISIASSCFGGFAWHRWRHARRVCQK